MALKYKPMRWADKNQGSSEHCACCGKPLTSTVFFIEVIEGGSTVIAPGNNPDGNDPGYMGFFPIGQLVQRNIF